MITDRALSLLNEAAPQVDEFDDEITIDITEQCLFEEVGTDVIMGLIESDAPEIGLLVEMGLLSERTIVRLDRRAKRSRAFTQAVYQIAKEENNKDFRKLVTVWKVRRALENKLVKKYAARAKQRVKGGKKKLGAAAAAAIVEKLKKFTPMKLGGGITTGLKMGEKSKLGRNKPI